MQWECSRLYFTTLTYHINYVSMNENLKRNFIILVLLVVTTSCIDRNGVIGAIFHLRNDSPLPSWIVIPQGISREQIDVTITRYEETVNNKWKHRFVVQDKNNGKVLQEEIGYGYWHPDSLREKAPA